MIILILHGIEGKAGDHWERWLNEQLTAKGHLVLMPNLPNSNHPDRKEWLETVKKLLKNIDLTQLIIVGHSLGVVTGLDFIEQASQKIRALISISGFAYDYGSDFNNYFLKVETINLQKVKSHLEKSFVIYGDNDPYVPQKTLKDLADSLGVTPKIIHQGQHLNTDAGYTSFPYLLEIIDNMEMVDIVDEKLNFLYRTSKGESHQKGSLHKCVIAEVINSKGEIMLARPRPHKQDPGQYVSPVGGHVTSGETDEEALKREVKEEIGISNFTYKLKGKAIYNRFVIGRQENHYFILYEIFTDEKPQLGDEAESYKWFTKSELKKAIKENKKDFGDSYFVVLNNFYKDLLR